MEIRMTEFSDKFGDFRVVRTKANDTAEPQYWIVRQDLEQILAIKPSKIVVQELPIPVSEMKVEYLECIALDDSVYSAMTGCLEKLAIHIQCNIENFSRIEEEEEQQAAEEDSEDWDSDDDDDGDEEDDEEDDDGEYESYKEYDNKFDDEFDLLNCAEMRASAVNNLCDIVDATPMDRFNSLAVVYRDSDVVPYDVNEIILGCYISIEELADCLQSNVSQVQKQLREKRFISEDLDHPIGKGRLYAFQMDSGEWRWHIKVLDILKS